ATTNSAMAARLATPSHLHAERILPSLSSSGAQLQTTILPSGNGSLDPPRCIPPNSIVPRWVRAETRQPSRVRGVDSLRATGVPVEVDEASASRNGEPAADAAEETQDSVTELLEELVRELGTLAFYEARLAAERNKPRVRRAARDVAAAAAV